MSRVIQFRRKGHKTSDGTVYWWDENHDLHREDGPAVEYPDGLRSWYLNGEQLTEGEHFVKSPYFKHMKDEDKVYYRLTIGE